LESGADPTIACRGTVSPFRFVKPETFVLITRLGRHFVQGEVNETDFFATPMRRVASIGNDGKYHYDWLMFSALVDADAAVEDVNSVEFYCLRIFGLTNFQIALSYAWHPENNDERDALIFLIQRGANIHAEDSEGKPVVHYAYTRKLRAYCSNRCWDCQGSLGGYRGDLFDAVVVACGYDLHQFRKDHPRKPCWTDRYQRVHFEQLWEGREHLCPYWNDAVWPASGSNANYDFERSCLECCRCGEGVPTADDQEDMGVSTSDESDLGDSGDEDTDGPDEEVMDESDEES